MIKLQRLTFLPEQFQDGLVVLNAEQKRYLVKVLRLQAADQFIVMDGRGHWWTAALSSGCSTATLLAPIHINNELPTDLTLVASPVKGKGFDEVVHSATELGVRHIYPFLSERTQVRPSEPKIKRWQKIAREAAEQSLRQFVPIVHQPISFAELNAHFEGEPLGSVLFCSTQPKRVPLPQALKPLSSFAKMTLITGPEGGWGPQEEASFEQLNFTGVSLGGRILRAVTAPICALSLIAASCESSRARD